MRYSVGENICILSSHRSWLMGKQVDSAAPPIFHKKCPPDGPYFGYLYIYDSQNNPPPLWERITLSEVQTSGRGGFIVMSSIWTISLPPLKMRPGTEGDWKAGARSAPPLTWESSSIGHLGGGGGAAEAEAEGGTKPSAMLDEPWKKVRHMDGAEEVSSERTLKRVVKIHWEADKNTHWLLPIFFLSLLLALWIGY